MTVPFRRNGLMENRRETLRRVDAMTVKVTSVSGRVLINGTGEITVEVPFPVHFAERPIFTSAGELEVNNTATAGSYPGLDAIVVGWLKDKEVPGVTEGYYVGARIATKVRGSAGQRLWLHYRFEAKALRNPMNSFGGLDQAL